MRRFGFWVLCMLMTLLCLAGAQAENVLKLPARTEVIEEEAFCGSDALNRVVLPEGVREIRSRAFANSALKTINLPDSLTFIAEDAFDGANVSFTTNPGTYAAEWVEHRSLVPTSPEDFTYSALDETTCAITGYTGSETSLMIPDVSPDGLFITQIASEAFYDRNITNLGFASRHLTTIHYQAFARCYSLKKVSLPQGLETIGRGAFAKCSQLAEVSLPGSLTLIDANAFDTCYSLKTINFPESLESIGANAFVACSSLREAAFPDSLKTIGIQAFQSSGLQTVHFGNGLESIEYGAFQSCSRLTGYIDFPDSLMNLGTLAFAYCRGLTGIHLPDAMTGISSGAFKNCFSLSEVNVPSGLETAFYLGFDGCSAIRNLVVPEGVTTLPERMFANMTSLVSVSLPETLLSTGVSAFHGCAGLPEIILPDSLESIDDYAFGGCTMLKAPVMPDSLRSIGAGAFQGCVSMESLRLPGHLESVGAGAFSQCTGLASAAFPASLVTIEDQAFSSCTALASLVFQEGTTRIGWRAFQNCTALTEAQLPDSVQYLGAEAFYGCESLRSVHYPVGLTSVLQTEGSIVNSPFYHCPALAEITVTEGVTVLPACVFRSAASLTNVNLPESLLTIERYAFNDCAGLASVTLPDGVQTIGFGAFMDCTALESAFFGEGMQTIGEDAFSGCSALSDLSFKEGLRKIDQWAFKNCTALTALNLPDSVTTLGRAFTGCVNVADVHYPVSLAEVQSSPSPFADLPLVHTITVPDGVTVLPERVFLSAENLTGIMLPDTLIAISARAFERCTNLTDPVLPDSLQSIGEYAFSSCTALESIAFPGSLRAIGRSAFDGCTGLTQLTFSDGEGPGTIGSFAFSGCTGLTGITFGEGLRSISAYAFYNCSSLTALDLPDSVVTIVSTAFSGCSSVTSVHYPLRLAGIPGGSPFSKLDGVRSIAVPEGVTTLLPHVFEKMSGLMDVTLPSTLITIGERAFGECSVLRSVSMQEGLRTISSSAFYGCDAMSSVFLPNGVRTIQSNAFSCSIHAIYIPPTVEFISSSMLRNDFDGIIYGHPDSLAEEYANQHGFTFASYTYPGYFPDDPVDPGDPEDPEESAYQPTAKIGAFALVDYRTTEILLTLDANKPLDMSITDSTVPEDKANPYIRLQLPASVEINSLEKISDDYTLLAEGNGVYRISFPSLTTNFGQASVKCWLSYEITADQDDLFMEVIGISACAEGGFVGEPTACIVAFPCGVAGKSRDELSSLYYAHLTDSTAYSFSDVWVKAIIYYQIAASCKNEELDGAKFAEDVLSYLYEAPADYLKLYLYSFFDYEISGAHNTLGEFNIETETLCYHVPYYSLGGGSDSSEAEILSDVTTFFHESGHAIAKLAGDKGLYSPLRMLKMQSYTEEHIKTILGNLMTNYQDTHEQIDETEASAIIAAILDDRNKDTKTNRVHPDSMNELYTITVQTPVVGLPDTYTSDYISFIEYCLYNLGPICYTQHSTSSGISSNIKKAFANAFMLSDMMAGVTNCAVHAVVDYHDKPGFWNTSIIVKPNLVAEGWAEFFASQMLRNAAPDMLALNREYFPNTCSYLGGEIFNHTLSYLKGKH